MPERQWRAAARLKVSVDCAESDWRCGPLQAHVGRIMVVQPDEEAWRSGRGATGARTARAVTISSDRRINLIISSAVYRPIGKGCIWCPDHTKYTHITGQRTSPNNRCPPCALRRAAQGAVCSRMPPVRVVLAPFTVVRLRPVAASRMGSPAGPPRRVASLICPVGASSHHHLRVVPAARDACARPQPACVRSALWRASRRTAQ